MKKSSIFECFRPPSITSTQLDRWLAGGWFRNGQQLFRTQLLLMNGELYTTINIRLPIKTHTFPKRLSKILRRNAQFFRHEVRPANFYSEDKQHLFDQHRNRFKGTSVRELWQHFSTDGINSYDTYELCIYNEERLVAVSFFDVGEKGLASIMGLFDQDFSKYSLGLYTMMLEVELGKEFGASYYYPGYVLDRTSSFDYKLRLGNYQRYDWNTKRWCRFEKSWQPTLATQVQTQLNKLNEALEEAKIGFSAKWYQYYLWQYYPDYIGIPTLLNSPMIFVCGYFKGYLVAGYDADSNLYFFARMSVYVPFDLMWPNIDFSSESSDRLKHQLDVLSVSEWIALAHDPDIVANAIQDLFRSEPGASKLLFKRNGWFQDETSHQQLIPDNSLT